MSTAPRLTDRKREAIVQAAIAEFRQNGFETTSMDRIADTACVSKRTVYNHFPSKDELFAEILQQLWQRSGQEDELHFAPDVPLRTQLLSMLGHKLQVMSDDNFLDLARIVVAATIHSPERAQGMIARIAEKESSMVRWIEQAQAAGLLRPADASIAAQQFHALVKAFAFWPQITLGMPVLTPEQQHVVAASAVDMFLACYQIKPQA
ncbi:MAG: TetR/AcrR family transcriptional regulator [Burkholderiales bacterium]|nr:TetR/AcrR family transcriptional regulator [Burkholderiales bacterium]